jgi:error-prone DNA polymerase
MEDLVRRTGVTTAQLEALATGGALNGLPEGRSRREALWAAGAVAPTGPSLEAQRVERPATSSTTRGRGRRRQPAVPAAEGELTNRPTLAGLGEPVRPRTGRLAGLTTGVEAPPLPEMTAVETNRADLWATGLSPESYPTEFVRAELAEQGVITAAGLTDVDDRARVTVAGVVTHRQRPATAQGTIFLNLEDETGLINVICSAGAWARFRRVARSEPALIIRGTVEKVEGVINVVAEHIQPLRLASTSTASTSTASTSTASTRATVAGALKSRDFR